LQVTNRTLIVEIVKNFIDDCPEFSWTTDQLCIQDEAEIEKYLRKKGHRLHIPDKFPTSIAELQNSIYSISKNFGIIETLFTVLSVAGLFYFWNQLFWISLAVAWVICNLVLIVCHEGWGHNYISPKNKCIGVIVDVFTYIFLLLYSCNKSIAHQKMLWKSHYIHHTTWLDTTDQILSSINNNWITHVFFKPIGQSPGEDFDTQVVEYLNTLSPIVRIIEKFSRYIATTIHILFLVYFGVEHYFYFLFLPIWYFRIYITVFSEVIPHSVLGNKKNSPWTFPLALNNAFHVTHHRIGFYLGPKWTTWINIQYLFIKLFYNIKVKIKYDNF